MSHDSFCDHFDLESELAVEGLTLADVAGIGMGDIDKVLFPSLTARRQHDIMRETIMEAGTNDGTVEKRTVRKT